MSWVEYHGHCWTCSDRSFYDYQKRRRVRPGIQPIGSETCQYCGMTFVKFSLALQQGTIIACSSRDKNSVGPVRRRIVDGIIIAGPET